MNKIEKQQIAKAALKYLEVFCKEISKFDKDCPKIKPEDIIDLITGDVISEEKGNIILLAK